MTWLSPIFHEEKLLETVLLQLKNQIVILQPKAIGDYSMLYFVGPIWLKETFTLSFSRSLVGRSKNIKK